MKGLQELLRKQEHMTRQDLIDLLCMRRRMPSKRTLWVISFIIGALSSFPTDVLRTATIAVFVGKIKR